MRGSHLRLPAAVGRGIINRSAVLALATVVGLGCMLEIRAADAQPSPDDVPAAAPPALLPTIDYDAESGTISADGRIESLRAFVKKLCGQVGIELLGYGAPDRVTRVRYRELPVQEALERLLWKEDYLLGGGEAQPSDGSAPEIVWLQILGTEGDDSDSAGATASTDGGDPIVLPRTGYTTRSTTIRKRTAEAFAKRLDDDEDARRRFLATPDATYTKLLGKESYAVAFLMDLAEATTERSAKMKVERLRRTLQARPRPW